MPATSAVAATPPPAVLQGPLLVEERPLTHLMPLSPHSISLVAVLLQVSPFLLPPFANIDKTFIGSPTSPSQQHQQVGGAPSQYPTSMYHHNQQQHHQQPTHDPSNPYNPHMMTSGYSYPGPNTTSPPGAPGQQLGGLAAAAAQHGHGGHWQQPPVAQGGGHYGRR